jgi:hypothetical protein
MFHCHRNKDAVGVLEHRKFTSYKNKPNDWLLTFLGMKNDVYSAYTLDVTNFNEDSNVER